MGWGKECICNDFKGKIEIIIELLKELGFNKVNWRENRLHYHIVFCYERGELLRLAERLSFVEENLLKDGIDFIKERL